jgi:hypothetical protein
MRQFALLIILASAAAAQAQKVTLRFNPPAGKTYSYAMTTSMTQNTPQGPMQTKQTMTSVMKIVKNQGGKVTMENSIKGAKVTGSGPAAGMSKNIETMLNGMKSTTVVDNLGRPLDVNVAGNNAAMQGMMSGMSNGLSSMYSYPKEAVGVGSKWSSTMDFQKMMGKAIPNAKVTGGKMPVTMTLKRLETRNGKKVAVIDIKMTGSMSMTMGGSATPISTTMNTTGELVVDLATGIPVAVKSVAKSTTSLSGMKMDQVQTTTMQLK